jgi:hypothetical protein
MIDFLIIQHDVSRKKRPPPYFSLQFLKQRNPRSEFATLIINPVFHFQRFTTNSVSRTKKNLKKILRRYDAITRKSKWLKIRHKKVNLLMYPDQRGGRSERSESESPERGKK